MNPPPPYAVFPPPQPPPPPLPPPPFRFPPPLPPYSAVSAASFISPIAASSAASDLPTALSSLTSLLQLTQSTLSSISSLLPLPSPKSPPLSRCPFNLNHLIPPASLFSHHLSCPSSSTPVEAEPLISSLHYPKTLHSTPFTHHLENPNSSEVCFSLENFSTFPENFFYSNSPGPVTISPCSDDSSFLHPMLTLPAVLSSECGNFTRSEGGMDEKSLNVDSMRLLPSEVWAVRCEISGWDQYPVSYSCRLLRLILHLRTCCFLHLQKWILMNSPVYGVVIDSALGDHIMLLFKLCLKAIVTESVTLAQPFIWDPEIRYGKKFHCPNLVAAMSWFGYQLSIVYGEVNGKIFASSILKQCLLDSASNSSIIRIEEKDNNSPSKNDGPVGNVGQDERKTNMEELASSRVYVSQVASAVAALYERSWLELKIKASRNPQPLSAYQRNVEHVHISKRANDERQKRSDYRPVIEYDGFLWQQSNNQDPNKSKTREELLAEERDYKRRRMSYRGKKMKRTTTQVMRDIIDEYMEEIKKVNSLLKGADEVDPRGSESYYVPGGHLSTISLEKDKAVDVVSRDQQDHYGGKLHNQSNQSILAPKENVPGDNVRHTGDPRKHQKDLENERSFKRARYDRDYSRSPHRQNDSHLQCHTRSRWKHSDPEISRERFAQSPDRGHIKSDGHKSRPKKKSEFHLENRSGRSRRGDCDREYSSSIAEFEDRYNPTGIDDGG